MGPINLNNNVRHAIRLGKGVSRQFEELLIADYDKTENITLFYVFMKMPSYAYEVSGSYNEDLEDMLRTS